ncbi:MAG: MoxR family ATPase [Planctomycetota bacterium]|nr:MoxR family ATPase [Planctomycetota bacterium]MDA1105002.1 MoxR family ATPase [Planctomycetota bacterium]
MSDLAALEARVQAASRPFKALVEQMHRVVVGQDELVEGLLLGILSNGHVLIEGVPGLAKTTAVSAMAAGLHTSFHRLQFTPDLLPADVVGTQVYEPKSGTFTVRKGPIFANIVLADEINRAPAKVQSALLEAMQERQVSIGGETFPLPQPFMVLATQNPIEHEGTYTLPEAQVDRFLLKCVVTYPDPRQERQILDRMGKTSTHFRIDSVMSPEDIAHARELVDLIHMDDRIKDYIVDLVVSTRQPKGSRVPIEGLIQYGCSPRATIALTLVAKAKAFLDGRAFTTPQDVKDVAHRVLRHRIGLSYEAEAEGRTQDDVVAALLSHVPVP